MLRILLMIFAAALFGCSNNDGPSDDAGSDTGAMDSALADASEDDAGEDDAGEDDAGEDDAGSDDAAADAGGADAGGDDAAADAGGDDAGADDAGAADAGRTIFEGACARTFGTCGNDRDCTPTGCGSETCAAEPIASTCDCTMPPATCGCIDGMCAWFN